MQIIVSYIRAIVKLVFFILFLIVFLPYGSITYFVSKPAHKNFLIAFLKTLNLILNIKVSVKNKQYISNKPKFFVSSHTSYLDVFIIGSFLNARFTPKIEVSKWPFVSYLVNLSMPLYINRNVKNTLKHKREIKQAIEQGDNIVVFPEATTNNGQKLLPFKSSFFSVAEPEFESDINEHIPIQPLSIIYTKFNGKKVDADNIDNLAWHGEMTFFPHFWGIFKAKSIEVEIIFHQEVYFNGFTDRKMLAKHCHQEIEAEFKRYID